MTDKFWPCKHVYRSRDAINKWIHDQKSFVLVSIDDFNSCPICGARRPEEKPKKLLTLIAERMERGGIPSKPVSEDLEIIVLECFEKMLPERRDLPPPLPELAGLNDGWNTCLEEIRRRIEEERET